MDSINNNQVNVGKNGWHSWAETDAANGFTPEQGKAMRMNPGNAARSNVRKTRSNFSYPTVSEWKAKYSDMTYAAYCEEIYGVKLR